MMELILGIRLKKDEGLMHFYWKERIEATPEEVSENSQMVPGAKCWSLTLRIAASLGATVVSRDWKV